jgi:hypothetical protein
LDIWFIVNKFKIPTIFISNKYIFQSNYEKQVFLAYGEKNDAFCFIHLPGLNNEKIPRFKAIISDKDEMFFSLETLKKSCDNYSELINAVNNSITIEEYLTGFIKPKKTVYKPKKPQIVEYEHEHEPIIISDVEKEKLQPIKKRKYTKKNKNLNIIENEDNPEIMNKLKENLPIKVKRKYTRKVKPIN